MSPTRSGVAGDPTVDLAAILDSIASLATTGVIVRDGTGSTVIRSITSTGAGVSVSNSTGIAGDPTIDLAAILDSIAALSSVGFIVRDGAGSSVIRSITAVGAGVSVSNSTGAAGDPTVDLDATLDALAGLTSTTGVVTQTAADTFTTRNVTGTTNEIEITNPAGVAGNIQVGIVDNPTLTGNVIVTGTVQIQSAGVIRSATGSPEDVVTEAQGGLYLPTDGRFPWFKRNGSGNDGWTPLDALPRRAFITGARADASAATISALGTPAWTNPATVSVSNTSEGTFLNYLTGSVSGNASGPNGPAIYRRDWGLEFVTHIRTVDITNIRIWAALSDADLSGNNGPTANFAGFRFSTGSGSSGPDTNWHCRCCDGATGTGADSGVAVAANTEYTLRMTLDSSKVRFYINDAFVVERTVNLPTATTLLAYYNRYTTLTSAGKNGRFGWAYVKEGS